jgi:hypothetical protein
MPKKSTRIVILGLLAAAATAGGITFKVIGDSFNGNKTCILSNCSNKHSSSTTYSNTTNIIDNRRTDSTLITSNIINLLMPLSREFGLQPAYPGTNTPPTPTQAPQIQHESRISVVLPAPNRRLPEEHSSSPLSGSQKDVSQTQSSSTIVQVTSPKSGEHYHEHYAPSNLVIDLPEPTQITAITVLVVGIGILGFKYRHN